MVLSKKKTLVTGAAGFIGSEITKKLLSEGLDVIGIDNLNEYYNPFLKHKRIKTIEQADYNNCWRFIKVNINDAKKIDKIFDEYQPNIVINLAAQAGVRYSLVNPMSYIESNIVGFLNILEGCRNYNVEHLIYASSSSVYGGNKIIPFNESHSVDHPISLYAATKKSNEILAHSYSHLFQIPMTGLRFFTVYGPWGRPDMAPMIFADAILNEKPINVFNYGKMSRDFTYIDDVTEAIIKCCQKPATKDPEFNKLKPNPASSFAASRIFNIGNSKSIELMYFIELLEKNLEKKAKVNFQKLQDGDVVSTYADNEAINKWIGFKPYTPIEEGIEKFCKWYIDFYNYKKN